MDDYKVPFRSGAEIARIAAEIRQWAGVDDETRFKVTLILELFKRCPLPRKTKLEIVFQSRGSRLPYVSYTSGLKLFVQRDILTRADQDDPDARFMLAHEIAHMVLHDHHAQRFSNDPRSQVKFAQDQESAEWQANRFADCFLVPARWTRVFHTVNDLANACAVPYSVANRRFLEEMSEKVRYWGEPCGKCQNFTLIRDHAHLKCDTCGNKKRIDS